MDITDLKETAALARLDMSEQELQYLFPAFEQMISLFDMMQAADKDETITAASPGGEDLNVSSRIVTSDYFRPDTATRKAGEDLTEIMLTKTGERDGRFVVIPNVL